MSLHIDVRSTDSDGIVIISAIFSDIFRHIQRFMYSDLNFLIFCLLFTIPRPVRTVA